MLSESDLANRLRGLAAIQEMLDMIGAPYGSDNKMAHIFCENELEIRAVVQNAMPALLEDMQNPNHNG